MARPRNDDSGGSLDSLLDTMTNLVGILIIVLMVTQLGVEDAVDRIAAGEQIDPEALSAAAAELEELSAQRETLVTQLDELAANDDDEFIKRNQQLQNQLKQVTDRLELAEQNQKQLQTKLKKDKETAEKLTAEFKKQSAERKKLAAQIEKSLEEISDLKGVLDSTRPRRQLPATEVRLPNPRPVPEGGKEITILCAGGKMYRIDPGPLHERAKTRATTVIKAQRLDRDPDGIIDEEQTEKYLKAYNALSIHDTFMEIELTKNADGRPVLQYNPRESAGLTAKQIEPTRSAFRKSLAATVGQPFYARFYVMPDSFETYIVARNIVNEFGLPAGWEPVGDTWKYRRSLGGELWFGKRPPPPKPNPNAGNSPPPKPRNVLD